MSPSPKFPVANSKYHWLVFFIFLGMILLGVVFLHLTESYIQDRNPESQGGGQEAFETSTFLLVFIAMAAGFPSIGMGTYLLYLGNQIRVTEQFSSPRSRIVVDSPIKKGFSARVRAQVLMVCGSLVIMSGLGLPLLAWWFAENL